MGKLKQISMKLNLNYTDLVGMKYCGSILHIPYQQCYVCYFWKENLRDNIFLFSRTYKYYYRILQVIEYINIWMIDLIF